MRKLIRLAAAALVSLIGTCSAEAAAMPPDTIVVRDTVYVMQVPAPAVTGQCRTSSTADNAFEAFRLDADGHYTPRLWPVEGEVYYGLSFPMTRYGRRSGLGGAQLGLEVRHNLREHPWSVGGGLGLYALMWESFPGDGDFNDTVGLQLYSCMERNFRRGSLFSPYVGGQVGLFMGSIHESGWIMPYVNLKAGMEFFHTLRLSVQTVLGPQYLCSAGLTLSVVLGGYPCR